MYLFQGCSNGSAMEHCPGQTDAEYRTEFSIWSITASNLIVATDIRNMTDIMKEVDYTLLHVHVGMRMCIINTSYH